MPVVSPSETNWKFNNCTLFYAAIGKVKADLSVKTLKATGISPWMKALNNAIIYKNLIF